MSAKKRLKGKFVSLEFESYSLKPHLSHRRGVTTSCSARTVGSKGRRNLEAYRIKNKGTVLTRAEFFESIRYVFSSRRSRKGQEFKIKSQNECVKT